MEPRTKRTSVSVVSGPPDSLHCFLFKCLDLANDWWSAYSRSLPFAAKVMKCRLTRVYIGEAD